MFQLFLLALICWFSLLAFKLIYQISSSSSISASYEANKTSYLENIIAQQTLLYSTLVLTFLSSTLFIFFLLHILINSAIKADQLNSDLKSVIEWNSGRLDLHIKGLASFLEVLIALQLFVCFCVADVLIRSRGMEKSITHNLALAQVEIISVIVLYLVRLNILKTSKSSQVFDC